MADKQPQTLVINNFTGALTRAINGDLNSGLAKFYSSWGFNPFKSPGNLVWNYNPIEYPQTIDGLVLDGQLRFESGQQFLYIITNAGKLYKFTPTSPGNAPTLLATLTTGSPTFAFGSSMRFYNGKIWITNDKGVSSVNFDGTGETQVGTWDTSHFIQDTYHPLAEFQGKLLIGNTTNGTSTNFGTIDTTNLVTNYNTVSPALPTGTYIRDMDITSDFSYLVISASTLAQEAMAAGNDESNSAAGESFTFRWNGSDPQITSGISVPNFGITALNNFGQTEYSFMYDAIGVALYDGGRKLATLTENKSPLPNASASSGNMIVWCAPEVEQIIEPAGQVSLNSMYTFGQMDDQSPVGLWRIFRLPSDLDNGSVNQVPFMIYTTNQYTVVTGSGTLLQRNTTQYFSRLQFNSGTTENQFFYFLSTYGIDIDQAPCFGVYETQTQLFSKKISISQIRVYCDTTMLNNAFQLEMIGTDGVPMENGTFTYTFGDILDPQTDAPELERINFSPDTGTTFGLGIRLTNIGGRNMRFTKIEIDYDPQGK